MTLKQLYDIEREKKTPAESFIDEVALISKKTPKTVRRWLHPTQGANPDELTQKVLADHFNTTPEELFPRVPTQ